MPALDFKGKSFVYTHHLSVPFRELVIDAKKSLPVKGQKPSLDDNLIIHGDNLHALKALLPVYADKIDCIYIDPPYNTGNEGWCYNDNVRSPLMKEWTKREANPVDKEDLERHDKWLCMMWPRLELLKELLVDDGAIFISIGDEELHRLLCLMDEVFGEDRQLAVFTRLRKKKGSNLADETRNVTDYVVAYRKGGESIPLYGKQAYSEKAVPLLNRSNGESVLQFPQNRIEVGARFPEGAVKPGMKGPPGELAVELLDAIKVENKKILNPFRLRGRFRWSQQFLDAELAAGSEFVVSADFRVNIYRAGQADRQKAPPTLLTPSEGVGTNEDGSDELARIFNDFPKLPFNYPKPASLVEFLVQAVALTVAPPRHPRKPKDCIKTLLWHADDVELRAVIQVQSPLRDLQLACKPSKLRKCQRSTSELYKRGCYPTPLNT